MAAPLADLRRLVTVATQLVVRHDLAAPATSAIAERDSLATLYEMTVTDVAEMLTCTEANVRARAARGSLPAGKIGREWRFNRREVLAAVTK